MKAVKIDINWDPEMPVFAREEFLRAVSDEYGWLGGYDETGKLRCILPYTIIIKTFFRLGRFRVETIPIDTSLEIEKEREFLNSCIDYFRSLKVDVIIPATTNSIFRIYPERAIAAPYGTYIIDLSHPEEILWKKIERITRQNIKRAINLGIKVEKYHGPLEPIHNLIRLTFRRSNLPFMNFKSFIQFIQGLGEYGLILHAHLNGVTQSAVIFGFSRCRAYAIYAGNAENLVQGSNKMLYWEAIRYFKRLGIKKYDFVGTRIDPEKGSKQEALSNFKKHFGCNLIQGYIWKYPLNPYAYYLYNLGVKLRSGGDIVDVEKHKLKYYQPSLFSQKIEK